MKNWIKIDRNENGLAAEECLSRIEHFYIMKVRVELEIEVTGDAVETIHSFPWMASMIIL